MISSRTRFFFVTWTRLRLHSLSHNISDKRQYSIFGAQYVFNILRWTRIHRACWTKDEATSEIWGVGIENSNNGWGWREWYKLGNKRVTVEGICYILIWGWIAQTEKYSATFDLANYFSWCFTFFPKQGKWTVRSALQKTEDWIVQFKFARTQSRLETARLGLRIYEVLPFFTASQRAFCSSKHLVASNKTC